MEAWHRLLEMIFRSFNAGPEFADARLALIINNANIRASEQHRLNFPTLGHYEHFIVDRINEVSLRLTGKRRYKWWSHTSHLGVPPSTFGITPLLPPEQYEDVSDAHIKDYPAVYKTFSRKMKSKVPHLPLHSATEFSLFTKNVQYYVGEGLSDVGKKGAFRFKEMTSDWNAGTLRGTPGKPPRISQEEQICQKLEEHLLDGYYVI